MLSTQSSKNILYVDENLDSFSNIAIGNLIRAVGEGKYVAYVNCDSSASKVFNFLENLSLNFSFVSTFTRYRIDLFAQKEAKSVSKIVLPQVEYLNLDEVAFWKGLKNYDVVIFDNFNPAMLSTFSLISHLNNKPATQSIIFVSSTSKIVKEIGEYFNEKIEIVMKRSNNLVTSKNIVCVYGAGAGKSTYVFGHLVRNFILKREVKLIYFDKGNYFGEMVFFNGLKKWSKQNSLYGSFDFVITGLDRISNNVYREENCFEDKLEARQALSLMQTAVRKQSPVVADEILTTIEKGLLSVEEVAEVLNVVEKEAVLTGTSVFAPLKKYVDIFVEVRNI